MIIAEYNKILEKQNRGKVAPSEHDLQVACINWFRATHKGIATMLFAIPNGGWRNPTTAAKLKAEGVVAGVPDLFLAVPSGEYHGLFIEMKNGKAGRLSEPQKNMITRLQNENYKCEVCHSWSDFCKIIKEYLK